MHFLSIQGYEEILAEDNILALDTSYDKVDIHESLLDLPKACGDEVAGVKMDFRSEDSISREESEALGWEKKSTNQTHVDVSATEINDGESKELHEDLSLKGSNVFSFCNEFYKLSEEQECKKTLQDIGEF